MKSRRLIVQTADSTRELLFLGRLTVGRASECDISLNDGKVSRRHAEFDATGPTARVTDLGSRNGLLVNNQKVSSADLEVGDVVVIGDASIRVEAVAEDVGTVAAVDPSATMSGEAQEPATPPEPMPVPPPVQPLPPADALEHADERTAIIPRSVVAQQIAPVAATPVEDDRTAVIPRMTQPPRPAPSVPAHPAPSAPAHEAPGTANFSHADLPLAPPAVDAAHSPAARAAAPAPPAGHVGGGPAATAATAAAPPLAGPRLSWGGMLMLLCVGLGALATLMAAIPLLSSSSQSIDALSTRQARTLVAWLADSASRESSVMAAETSVQAVLRQDGVADAMVLDAGTGRVVAPVRLAGRAPQGIPEIEGDWRDIRDIRVMTTGPSVHALAPFTRGESRQVAWVRYDLPSTSDQSVALIVALIGTMVLALVASLLLRRHTAATLGLFTRQVEMAVSGADHRVMRGSLLPGLERLPGIVSYLLEQRKAGIPVALPGRPGGLAGAEEVAVEDAAAWIEVTPSLSVTQTSPHAPPTGIRNWASGAKGKHLLDVLEPGPLCNAVVQGLGALSNAPGSAMTVPAAGASPVTLRRATGGSVRIELPMR